MDGGAAPVFHLSQIVFCRLCAHHFDRVVEVAVPSRHVNKLVLQLTQTFPVHRRDSLENLTDIKNSIKKYIPKFPHCLHPSVNHTAAILIVDGNLI